MRGLSTQKSGNDCNASLILVCFDNMQLYNWSLALKSISFYECILSGNLKSFDADLLPS